MWTGLVMKAIGSDRQLKTNRRITFRHPNGYRLSVAIFVRNPVWLDGNYTVPAAYEQHLSTTYIDLVGLYTCVLHKITTIKGVNCDITLIATFTSQAARRISKTFFSVSSKKRPECFCNIFYKTPAILMKFGTLFLNKFAA